MASPSLPLKSWTSFRVSAIIYPWILLSLSSPVSVAAEISYADHCGAAIAEAKPTVFPASGAASFRLSGGSLSGGAPLFDSSSFPFGLSLLFRPHSLFQTQTLGVFRIEASLSLRDDSAGAYRRNLSKHRLVPRGLPPLRSGASFNLSGYVHEPSGLLCMVGAGSAWSKGGTLLQLSAVFNLHFPTKTNISSSSITGKLESLDAIDGANHFDPISILVYTQKNYEYTKISEAKDSCSRLSLREQTLRLDNNRSLCHDLRTSLEGVYIREHGRNCSSNGNRGNYLRALGSSLSFFTLNRIHCSEDGRVRMSIEFSNDSTRTLAEGFWDRERSRLCLVSCRSLGDATVGDCALRFSFWFPAVCRGTVAGRIWINKSRTDNDPGHFEMVSFRSFEVEESGMSTGAESFLPLQSEWRMRIEVAMVLIFLVLSCGFIGLQLFYVRSHSDLMPRISFAMLVIWCVFSCFILDWNVYMHLYLDELI